MQYSNLLETSSQKFDDVINIKIKNKYTAHEKYEHSKKNLLPTNSIFLVGPEDGFTNDEIIKASEKGFKIICLGKRILWAGTAS